MQQMEEIDNLYDQVSKMEKEDRIKKLGQMVDDIVYASKGPELTDMSQMDLRLTIDGLSSALGMAIAHLQGERDSWDYIQQNVFCAYRKVFRGAASPSWK